MSGLEEMLRMKTGDREKTPIIGEEREKLTELMQHVADLEAGERLQWKRGLKNTTIPYDDQAVEVFRVFPIKTRKIEGSNHDLDEDNFSVLFRSSSGEVMEYAFDSRRFERVE